jgi:acetyltransferase-like isoleucine patch superfamily enzyme
MMRRELEKGKMYPLSRFFVSAHETRVFWRKLFIASCEAPFSFTPLCNVAWRWAGASVGRKGVVLSELHGAVDAPELVSIGDDCYLGAHVTLRPLKVEGSSVKAVGVSIGDGCFVGPNTLLQPGSMVKGATGANSIINSHEIVPDGRVAIGDAEKPCTLAWRPHRLDASSEWGWFVTSSLAMFATERLGHVVAVQAPRILLWVALGFVGRYPWSPPLHEVRVASLIHEAHTTPLLRVWLTLSTVASRNAALVLLLVACLIVADPLKPLTHIVFKWLVVGKAKETSKVPLRSGQHLRWACVQKLARCPAVDGAWRHVYEYASMYASCVGFKLGSRVRFYPYPSLLLAGAAEADLVEIGDDTVTSAATYAHDFSMLHLAKKPTSIGGGCDLGLSRHGQVLPGSHLPAGTVIQAPGRATHLAGLCGEAHQAWAGNPLVRCAALDAEYADAC